MGSDTDSRITPELLALLVCPETRQPLQIASGEVLARLPVRLAEGLVREDGKVVYPIDDGIPVLTVDEGIAVLPVSPDVA